jgi:hypothetical protein
VSALYWTLGLALGCAVAAPATCWILHRRRTAWERAAPLDTDPDAPIMTEVRCAALGHAVVRKHREGRLMKSCPRCGWWERMDLRDFDARQ